MHELLEGLARWRATGESAVLARLVDVEGSGPRAPGAAMAVSERGEVLGSVTGGCVEGAVVHEAAAVLASGVPRAVTFGYGDDEALEVGLTCGGVVHLYLEPLDGPAGHRLDVLSAAFAAHRPAVVATLVQGPGAGAELLVVDGEPSSGELPDPELDRVVRRDAVLAPPPRLLVFGAVDVAAALVRVATVLGYHVTVSDAREVFATRARFPHADEVVVDWPQRLLADVDPADLGSPAGHRGRGRPGAHAGAARAGAGDTVHRRPLGRRHRGGSRPMELTNDFRVSLPPERAWAVLTDLERIAPCMPGAQLQEIEGDDHRGTVKVEVGPITAEYAGRAAFVERDEAAGRAVLRAEGKETRGQGNASATITAQLRPDGDGTAVSVVTDLTVTGRVAHLGRGVLADVSAKLLDQFVANLEATVVAAEQAPAPNPGPAELSELSAAPAEGEAAPAGGEGTSAEGETAPAEAEGPATSGARPAWDTPPPPHGAGVAAESVAERRSVESPEAAPVDLVRTAGGPVAKRVGPIVALVALAWLLKKLFGRRRG